MLGRDSETRRRKKDSDRDSPKDKDKDKEKEKDRKDRHRSSRSSRSKTSKEAERDTDGREHRPKKSSSHTHSHSSRKPFIVPEMERNSPGSSRTSLPYPSFSKAHSREAVGSKDSLAPPKAPLYTPDPTDLGQDGQTKSRDTDRKPPAPPPSPPLTAAEEPELNRSGSRNSTRKSAERTRVDGNRRSMESPSRASTGPKYSTSRSTLRESTVADNVSEMTKGTEYSLRSSSAETPTKVPPALRAPSPNGRPPASTGSHPVPSATQSITDSDATSVAPERKPARKTKSSLFQSEAPPINSSPHTPTIRDTTFPHVHPDPREPTPIEVFDDDIPVIDVKQSVPAPHGMPPPPPPPPPPPAPSFEHPRVDYLLQYGGLNHHVSRSLFSAASSHQPIHTYQQYTSPRVGENQTGNVRAFFAPVENLLEDYSKVMGKNGSMAVATGYRSVARRLLDRLEAVFSRNISEERCQCIMCHSTYVPQNSDEERGVSWGEILEYVSGRRELPPWPPFSMAPTSAGLGISGQAAPMQRVDIDVPEEYREHYIRQSKKTKHAVQSWLTAQPEEPPPEDVDDATLGFAILTKLEEDKRPIFSALLRGQLTIPVSRSQTPLGAPQPELLKKTSLALQRLYRLGTPASSPQCAIFLLKYPELHPVLATLAAVSSGEWDILVSGRFDGFLWSGADSSIPGGGTPPSRGPSRGPAATPLSRNVTPFSPGVSRGPTPFSPFQGGRISRGPTPAPPSSFGAPVQMDEETEIAVLAEVERDIYMGMEALEDAFERLHLKAEAVRNALRERSAGLSMAAQARRGSMAEDVEVRMGTPASMYGMDRWDSETDDGIDDERSEIAPDDSASNISYNRTRRRGQRERRTPAPVAEEDETVFSEDFRDR